MTIQSRVYTEVYYEQGTKIAKKVISRVPTHPLGVTNRVQHGLRGAVDSVVLPSYVGEVHMALLGIVG